MLATLGSLKKKSEYYDVTFLIRLSERLPLINLLVAYCKSEDSSSLIWVMILTLELRSLICCDSPSIYLSFDVNYY